MQSESSQVRALPRSYPVTVAHLVLVLRITHLQAVGLAVGAALVLAGCLLSVQRCATL